MWSTIRSLGRSENYASSTRSVWSGWRWSSAAFVATWLLGACTFYTAPPNGNTVNGTCAPTGTGGTSGIGGSGTGGTSGSGGSMAGSAGGSIVMDAPIPDGDWYPVTPSFFSGIQDQCGPMSYLSSKPDEDMIIAGLNTPPVLWASPDGGQTWNQLGTSKDSDPIDHGVTSIVYDPAHSDVFWETGSYGSHNGVYKSTDDGTTLKHLGDPYHDDFISVDLSDPDRNTLLVTKHEAQSLLKSTDGGDTWVDIAGNIPANMATCTYTMIVDTQTYLLGCGGRPGGGTLGILRSTDAGDSWDMVYGHAGASGPLLASDGTIYWAGESGGGLASSSDNGVTFIQVTAGTLLNVTPVELPDGRIASLTSDTVVISSDQGVTWKTASTKLPYTPNGFIYSSYQKAFFIWYFLCGDPTMQAPPDAIERFDFDYESF
jgi:photosystem II stability/assembly factor-like uncharacterized protein